LIYRRAITIPYPVKVACSLGASSAVPERRLKRTVGNHFFSHGVTCHGMGTVIQYSGLECQEAQRYSVEVLRFDTKQ
jgi:hypothetical protein